MCLATDTRVKRIGNIESTIRFIWRFFLIIFILMFFAALLYVAYMYRVETDEVLPMESNAIKIDSYYCSHIVFRKGGAEQTEPFKLKVTRGGLFGMVTVEGSVSAGVWCGQRQRR